MYECISLHKNEMNFFTGNAICMNKNCYVLNVLAVENIGSVKVGANICFTLR